LAEGAPPPPLSAPLSGPAGGGGGACGSMTETSFYVAAALVAVHVLAAGFDAFSRTVADFTFGSSS